MHDVLDAFRAQDWPRALPQLKALHERRPHPVIETLLGITLLHLRQIDAAAYHLAHSLSVAPDQIDARYHLGILRYAGGELEEAAEHMTAVLAARPDHLSALLHLARCRSEQGKVPEAIAAWRRLTEVMPGEPEPWLGLASGLAMLGAPDEAIHAAHQAVVAAPWRPDARAKLGLLLVERGRLDEAEPHLRAAEGDVDALIGLTELMLRRGRLAEAEEILRGVDPLQMTPALFDAWARLQARQGRADFACRKADIMLEVHGSSEDLVLLLHTRAALHDTLGNRAAAFSDWTAANNLRPATFSPAQNAAETDAIISATSGPLPQSHEPPEPIVLIVGMPRSGTSLLEQMLDAHPDLIGCGEQRALHDAIQTLPGYPASARSLHAAPLSEAGLRYRDALASFAGRDGIYIDKMPHNFRNLGAAVQLLPGVKILHCVRDPVDVCFSCYRQRFRDGMSYTTRQEWLGTFYNDYVRLMAHWRRQLPPGVLLDVRYEDLVGAPEATVSGVLSFLGLPFDARCLSPESNRRGVATASRDEVTQPVHARSVGRASAYREHLGPLLSVLGVG